MYCGSKETGAPEHPSSLFVRTQEMPKEWHTWPLGAFMRALNGELQGAEGAGYFCLIGWRKKVSLAL